MSAASLTTTDTIQTIDIRKETYIEAPPEITFQAILEEIGPGSRGPDGTPFPMKLEPWPGGRWYRDLGEAGGHMYRQVTRLFLLLISAIAAFTASARADDLSARVDAYMRSEMASQKIPGVALAVIEQGRVVLAKGYGTANVEHGVPVDADTIFQSGSLGKQFTAVLIMLLADEGKLTIEDPLSKFFPAVPESWRAITIRHLLTHTSGIPDYTDSSFDLQRNYSEAQLLGISFGLKLEFTPGSRWNYSNTGYMLLGFVAQQAGGASYESLLHDRVFVPLGMKTARVISEADIVAHRAGGYRLDGETLKNQEWVAPTLNTTADGCLYFSLTDLIAWDQAWRNGSLLSKASWEQMLSPVRLNSGKT